MLPAVVAQRLPEISKQLFLITLKVRTDRLDVCKENEDYLKKEAERREKGLDTDDEDEDEEDEGMTKDETEDDEYQKTLNVS